MFLYHFSLFVYLYFCIFASKYYLTNKKLMKRLVSFVLICLAALTVKAQMWDFVLPHGEKVPVYVQQTDAPVTQTALEMLAGDMKKVIEAEIVQTETPETAKIVAELEPSLPREGFRYYIEKGILHIKGADAHGLAYGLLELSRAMGVSPWEWWADCEPVMALDFVLSYDFIMEQCPAVAYRGIFINDEDWGILPWSGGTIGPETNEKIFQLLLRLHANTYWPAMHEVSKPFFSIPGNREMAHKYGIYIGGSHCEPMATSPATEWAMRGKGEYNYASNDEAVRKFWTDRVDEVKDQEIIYTLGMRGVHDGAMQGAQTKEEKLELLQQVIDDQREILSTHVNTKVSSIPQVFIPYKEVLDVYHAGLDIPEDVTLMWTDDNYGYIRHFPNEDEMMREGGNGIYYHASYWGRPHDYLWLGTASPFLMRQQLTEAYMRGADKMWILNVGDIKPSEYQIETFLTMAWHGLRKKTTEERQMRIFYKREFGGEVADTLTSIMRDYYKLSFQRKPEHMGGTRVEEADKEAWSKFHPVDGWTTADVEKRVSEYKRLSDAVEAVEKSIPANRKDAFFQLVKYPVQAAAQMNFKFLCPDIAQQAYDSIASLTHIYNNGKWNGIMDKAPRKLPVFGKVETPIQYPAPKDQLVLFDADDWKAVPKSSELAFNFGDGQLPQLGSQLEIEVRLLPTHPIEGSRLAFSVLVDNDKPVEVEYQTVDRSEEWKQNVLRNYALRKIVVPFVPGRAHRLVFTALTDGVLLERIALSKPEEKKAAEVPAEPKKKATVAKRK